MQTTDDMLIWVQREWDGWRTAQVRLGDLQNIHWFQPPRAPRPVLHGYVSCASMTTGEIPHHCERTDRPHTLLVCVLKSHHVPSVYAEIARRAGEQPIPMSNGQPLSGGHDSPYMMGGTFHTIRRPRSR
jgi:hypothetical protein